MLDARGYLKFENVLKRLISFDVTQRDADEWQIAGAVDGVPQQQNGFDCGVFACMFADFLSRDRPLCSFDQDYIINQECRERIAFSILNGAVIE